MKETILEKNHHLPYSLHDMVIEQIEIEGDQITLHFEDGIEENKEPYRRVDGRIVIKGVDEDFGVIQLLSESGTYGSFNGRKLELKDFIKEFKEYRLEIVDELYGFNRLEYGGFLSLPECENFIEYSFALYYTGDLVYITEESP